MRKSHLSARILVTLVVAIISSIVTKADSVQTYEDEQGANKTFLIGTTPISWPQNNPSDPCSPEFKTTISRCQIQTPYCVRINRILFCLLETALQETRFEESRPQNDIALSSFFLTLFNAIISPNAP